MTVLVLKQDFVLILAATFVVAHDKNARLFSNLARYPEKREALEIELASNVPEKCQATHVNILARHGVFFPNKQSNAVFNFLNDMEDSFKNDAVKRKILDHWQNVLEHFWNSKQWGPQEDSSKKCSVVCPRTPENDTRTMQPRKNQFYKTKPFRIFCPNRFY